MVIIHVFLLTTTMLYVYYTDYDSFYTEFRRPLHLPLKELIRHGRLRRHSIRRQSLGYRMLYGRWPLPDVCALA